MSVGSTELRHPEPSAAQTADVRRAWARYLRETRDVPPVEYPAAEERAWQRLVGTLRALDRPPAEPGE